PKLHAKVDGKSVIISEASIKSDVRFRDEGGIACLPNEAIFEQLTLIGAKTTAWNEFSSTIASAVICLATNQQFNFSKYIFESMLEEMANHTRIYVPPSYTKKVFANIKRQGKEFSEETGDKKPRRKDIELPQTSVPTEVVADEVVYEDMYDSEEMVATTATGLDAEQDRGIISKTQFTTTLNKPSSIGTSSGSGPRRQETMGDDAAQTRSERVSKFSNGPPLSRVNTLGSGDDTLKLDGFMELCTQLQSRVFALETTKTNQALEIGSLKRRVKKLEKKASKRNHKLKGLYKICSSKRIESSDEASLDDQEDASKQKRIIDNLDADKEVTLVDETQGMNDQDMFDTGVLDDEEVVAKKEVSTADPVTIASEVVTTAGVEVSAAATTPIISMDDITLAKALAALKSAKPMDKGKAKMIKAKKPLKKKYQIIIDEEVATNLEAKLQAELEEEKGIARQKEKEANIALTAEWDDVQAIMDADHELAERLQEECKEN
nr:hypothetical protein [Tanacetum cinerariifolium]